MNFLAHGRRHLDQPWTLAGTALPDWLAASERRTHLRHVPDADPDDEAARSMARGVAAHLADDARFHGHPAFRECEDELTLRLRALHSQEPRQRSRFLAHVLTEQLLDAALSERRPDALERYHQALSGIDAEHLARVAGVWVGRPLPGLPAFVGRFLESRFLADYATDEGVLLRLRGVARRVGLPPIAPAAADVIPLARRLVASHADALLAPAT